MVTKTIGVAGVKTVRLKLSHCMDSLPRTVSVNSWVGRVSLSLNPDAVQFVLNAVHLLANNF
jgi:hypothetical protein